ncbi:MAG TPA: permease prefix domain 1-containing protein [Candidatus Limnocylindrales bacterium]|nr:permease prefix domain 1-containing protein [Candidatus Limnocylindrales bacterium]
MIPSDVENVLRGHVASVLASADVPRTEREDLAEELYGHLAERWQVLVDDGTDPEAAAERAIAGFGSADRIGRDLTSTYRGRFWSSTIGMLLPASARAATSPGIVWWLAASMRAYAVFSLVYGASQVLSLSPVRAALVAVAAAAWAGILLIGAMALSRRQRWALDLAIVANVAGILFGLGHMVTTPGLFSLNVLASGAILLAAAGRAETLGAWVRGSQSIRNGLAFAILLTATAGNVVPVVASDIGDPTQAGRDDLHLDLALDCQPTRAVLSADVRWDRTSLLPGGIGHLSQYGDALVLDHSSEEVWMLDNYPMLVDAATGLVAAEPDEAFAPNQQRTIEALRGPFVIQIPWNALEPGVTYSTEWVFVHADTASAETLAVAVEYIHADQFRWEALANCDGGVGEPSISDWP